MEDQPASRAGRVVLVGAGPGGPGLLTVAALEVLRNADVVFYDRLAGPAFRRFVRPTTELVDVGKRPGASELTQAQISAALTAEAHAGRTVVRVKGGDPFVFGRGYEEVMACAEAGVPVEVVPGVTSATGAAAAAGIPLTHRGMPPVFTVVSGHEDPAKAGSGVDWDAIGRSAGPVVVLMGVATAGLVAGRLLAAGRPPDTPVAAIERATTREQRVVRTTLSRVEAALAAEDVRSPALLVIGENAALGDGLPAAIVAAEVGTGGFAARGLGGWRVIVPRSRGGESTLVHLLRAEGADVIVVPVVAFLPPLDAGGERAAVGSLDSGEVTAVVFTSENRVDAFSAMLRRHGRDLRALAGVRLVGASGRARLALDRLGLRSDASDLESTDAASRGLALVPAQEGVTEILEPGVVRVDVFRQADLPVESVALAGADAVVLASSGTAAAWGRRRLPVPPVVACVGPSTAEAARASGIHVDVMPDTPGLPAVVAALTAFAAQRGA